MDDKQRIERVLKGDTSAFGYFVDTYQDMAVTIAYRICNNKQDAEDIVQNAFVKAFHNLRTFRSDSKFSTWFYRIVYNTAVSQINTSVFSTELVDYNQGADNSFSDFDTLDIIEEREKQALIQKTMEKMPPDESLVLTLFYLEENSIKEIMQITGLSEANVKVRLHRARKRFGDVMMALSAS